MIDRLDQFIPVLDPGDAASNHTLEVQKLLRHLGVRSDIYTEQTHPSLAPLTRDHRSHDGVGRVIYQFAIGSQMCDALLAGTMPLAVNHHNVTPARFFESWDPGLVHGTTWGQHQLGLLAARAELAVAVSRFNAAELGRAGFVAPTVAPLLVDPTTMGLDVDPSRVDQLRDRTGAAWVFVGRIVPNKAQHRLIAALAVYRRTVDPEARLWLVGGASSVAYERALVRYAAALGLSEAVEFTGWVPTAERNARMQAADVLVCASEHEGFCVPLLEAIACDLPVVAVDAGAVAETLGAGGLVVPESSPLVLSSAVELVLSDPDRRRRLVAAGRRRLSDFSLEANRAAFRRAMAPWLDSAG